MASTSDDGDGDGERDARVELERGLRTALLVIEELRKDVLRLAAQVVAQGEALAKLGGPAVDDEITARTDELAVAILDRDSTNVLHVELAPLVDKYTVETGGPPCLELLPICGARCCGLSFPLSSQDLDEGVIQWDHGRPYLIRHSDDRVCVHLDREHGRGCTAYEHRPATCRTYDCRTDPRIWLDFERRLLAPPDAVRSQATPAELASRGRERDAGLAAELVTLRLRR